MILEKDDIITSILLIYLIHSKLMLILFFGGREIGGDIEENVFHLSALWK